MAFDLLEYKHTEAIKPWGHYDLGDQAMKMKPEHLAIIKQSIKDIARDEVLKYADRLKQAGKFTDFGKRIRWDLFHAINKPVWVCDTLYVYLNDSHIDSALKAIMRELNYPEFV
jgi:hypothetical protein